MSKTSSPTPSAPRGATVAAFMLSTLTIALVGCALISAAIPFVKTTVASRHLDIARARAGDRQEAAQAIVILRHLQPVLKPYRKHADEGYQLLARAHAARGQHDDAAKTAQKMYHRISSPPSGSAPQTDFLTAWGAQLYNRITADQIAGDPWVGYRELAQQYQAFDDRQGMQHMQEHLDQHYSNHPWHKPADRDIPPERPDIAPIEKPEPKETPRPPDDADEAKPQWALPLPDGATAYNVHRERLREVPADTLIDIHEHTVWDTEPMVHAGVHVLNRWVSNIFLRTSQIAIQDGSAKDVCDREKRLHMNRLETIQRIHQEEKNNPPTPPPDRTPDDTAATATSRQDARRQLRELEQRHARLHEEMQQAEGHRRAELIDELRRMGMHRYRLQQAAAGVVETLDAPTPETAEPDMPPPESPQLQRLRQRLEDIDTEIQRLSNSE